MRRPRTAVARLRTEVRQRYEDRLVRRMGLVGLIRRTATFRQTRWLGRPIWQNPLDAWALQEAIVENDVDLVIECGTHRGGSAYFMASIFDLLGRGHVITVDIEPLAEVDHARIDFITGSSVDPEVFALVKARIHEIGATRPMVVLDSDHAGPHVLRELELYAELVPVGGYVAVQDGCIDELRIMRDDRPGPLWAVKQFVGTDRRFEVDEDRSGRYLFSNSPSGWLRRVG